MKKLKLPRKLKKGCRTLSGTPRTKWQRKGCAFIARTLKIAIENVTTKVCAYNLLRESIEQKNHVSFKPGGIVQQNKRENQMESGEYVINGEHLSKMKHNFDGSIPIVSEENFPVVQLLLNY